MVLGLPPSRRYTLLLNQQRMRPGAGARRARRCWPRRRWCAARRRVSPARRITARSTCSSPPRPRPAARPGLWRALAMRAALQHAAMFLYFICSCTSCFPATVIGYHWGCLVMQ